MDIDATTSGTLTKRDETVESIDCWYMAQVVEIGSKGHSLSLMFLLKGHGQRHHRQLQRAQRQGTLALRCVLQY